MTLWLSQAEAALAQTSGSLKRASQGQIRDEVVVIPR
jgi:hypothetical protein